MLKACVHHRWSTFVHGPTQHGVESMIGTARVGKVNLLGPPVGKVNLLGPPHGLVRLICWARMRCQRLAEISEKMISVIQPTPVIHFLLCPVVGAWSQCATP